MQMPTFELANRMMLKTITKKKLNFVLQSMKRKSGTNGRLPHSQRYHNKNRN